MLVLRKLLEDMISGGASDLHITVGTVPKFRIDGELVPAAEERVVPEVSQKLAYSILNEQQRKQFEDNNELDFSFGIANLSRFRGNIFLQRGVVALSIRSIPFEIRSFEDLGLPSVVEELAARPTGLVLVTGGTGSGKSTTLAAMVDKINRERAVHIVTIEDPIEFVHRHKKAIINQRQLHSDTNSFPQALKSVLRQDPDVILVGEMRDMETIEAALTIAETGHLCFGTLHTNSAAQTINRIIDVFPSAQQTQIRTQLSFVLEGVVSQILLPKVGGGRVMAAEILVLTPALRAIIRDDKIQQIGSVMQTGAKFGMQTMNMALVNLIRERLVEPTDALKKSPDPAELSQLLDGKGSF
jgi:twitching motility protein PilT